MVRKLYESWEVKSIGKVLVGWLVGWLGGWVVGWYGNKRYKTVFENCAISLWCVLCVTTTGMLIVAML